MSFPLSRKRLLIPSDLASCPSQVKFSFLRKVFSGQPPDPSCLNQSSTYPVRVSHTQSLQVSAWLPLPAGATHRIGSVFYLLGSHRAPHMLPTPTRSPGRVSLTPYFQSPRGHPTLGPAAPRELWFTGRGKLGGDSVGKGANRGRLWLRGARV